MTKLLVATQNRGKVKEFSQLLGDLADITWLSLWDVALGDIDVEETGSTFEENAALKAQAYSQASGLITLADDSGLVVDALNGAPGIYSARYGAPDVSSDQGRYELLLKNLAALNAPDRSARFVCAIAIGIPHQPVQIVKGFVEGTIAAAPRGENGFGYDPIFLLPDGRTMAEIPAEEKNAISHRGNALKVALPILRQILAD